MKTLKTRQHGYTLLETVCVVGLVGMIAGMTGMSFSKLKSRSGAQGFATLVVEEVRRARQEAITHRRPVAFVIPKGSENFSRSFYAVEGETIPRVVRSNNYPAEFNGAGLFVGTWTSASTTAGLPAPSGSKWATFNVGNWISSMAGHAGEGGANDFYFVFLPDGSVRTNNLPAFDDAYHIVVANGVASSGGVLNKSGDAFTISISAIGGVSLSGGIPKSSSVQIGGSMANSSGVPLAAPLVSRPLGAITPTVDPLTGDDYPSILPRPNPTSGPIKAYVKVGEFLTFEMGCKSSEGEELFGCYMIAVKPSNSTSRPGAFSMRGTNGTLVEINPASPPNPQSGSGSWMAEGGRMEWSQTEQCWRSTWQWTPPPNAQPGDEYTLTPLVRNTPTGAPQTVGVPQTVRITFPGVVLFQSDRTSDAGPGVYSMQLSGHNQKVLKPGASEPTATLNGSRIAWVRGGNIEMSFRESAANGMVLNDTTKPACDMPALNPMGNFIAFRRAGHVYAMNTIPENNPNNAVVDCGPCQVANGATVKTGTEKMSWSPNGLSLFFVNAGGQVMEQKFQPNQVKPIAAGPPTVVPGLGGADSFGGTPWCGLSVGVDGTIFIMNNWNQSPNGYDPWFWRFTGGVGWYHKTVSDEEVTPERNPGGGFRVLEGWRNSAANKYMIRMSDNSGASAQNAVFVDDLTNGTTDGNCTYPVWTER